MSSRHSYIAAVVVCLVFGASCLVSADSLPEGAMLRMGSSRLSHGTWLTSVQFSADDRFVGTADSKGVVRLWEVDTGKMVWEKPARTGRELAFSPDGKILAVSGGYYNGTIKLWDLKKDEVIRKLPQSARSIKFSKDGRWLVAAGEDAIVRLWDVRTGDVKEFKGHVGRLYAVAISPDGRMLASGGGGAGTAPGQNEVRLWDTATGKELAQLHEDVSENPRLRGWVYGLDFSRDGKTLAVASPYAVRIWDIASRKQMHCLTKCSYDAAFSPAADRLVMPGEFGIYDPRTGKKKTELAGEVRVYGCVAYSHDGTLIASGNKEGYIQLWDARTGKERVRRSGHEGGIRCVSFSADGKVAASVSREDQTIRIWGTASGAELRKIPMRWHGSDVWWNEEGSDVWFEPTGRKVVTWTYDGSIHYWTIDGSKKRSIKLGTSTATTFVYANSGTHAAVGEYDGGSRSKISIYELDGGKQVASLNPFGKRSGSDNWISAMAISPDGKQLAVGTLTRSSSYPPEPSPSVQIWNIAEEKLVGSIRSATAPPGKVCFSPDGSLLATSASGKAWLQVWRTSDATEVHNFKMEVDHHGRDPAAIAFSADGKLLAAADANHEIYVWELVTGKKLQTFAGHQKAVTSLAFSPDGKTLLSGSEDTTMLLWDVSGAGSPTAELTEEQLEGHWQALAVSDKQIATAAIKTLMGRPGQALVLFDKRLTAGPALDETELPVLISQLTGTDAEASSKAAKRLQEFGAKASPTLFNALASATSARDRTQIELTLRTIGKYPVSAGTLRRTRAIQMLEQIGNEDARRILQRLANTQPPTPASQDAAEAIKRLKWR